MKNTTTTLDRLKQAKDALIYAKHSAERELTVPELKQLQTIIDKTETLQNKIKHRAN